MGLLDWILGKKDSGVTSGISAYKPKIETPKRKTSAFDLNTFTKTTAPQEKPTIKMPERESRAVDVGGYKEPERLAPYAKQEDVRTARVNYTDEQGNPQVGLTRAIIDKQPELTATTPDFEKDQASIKERAKENWFERGGRAIAEKAADWTDPFGNKSAKESKAERVSKFLGDPIQKATIFEAEKKNIEQRRPLLESKVSKLQQAYDNVSAMTAEAEKKTPGLRSTEESRQIEVKKRIEKLKKEYEGFMEKGLEEEGFLDSITRVGGEQVRDIGNLVYKAFGKGDYDSNVYERAMAKPEAEWTPEEIEVVLKKDLEDTRTIEGQNIYSQLGGGTLQTVERGAQMAITQGVINAVLPGASPLTSLFLQTAVSPSTYAGMQERTQDKYAYDINTNTRNLIAEGVSPEEAIVKGYVSSFVELGIERFVGKWADDAIAGTTNKFWANTIDDIAKETTKKGVMKKTLDAFNIQGVVGENVEEELQAIFDAVWEGNEYYAPTSPEGAKRVFMTTVITGLLQVGAISQDTAIATFNKIDPNGDPQAIFGAMGMPGVTTQLKGDQNKGIDPMEQQMQQAPEAMGFESPNATQNMSPVKTTPNSVKEIGESAIFHDTSSKGIIGILSDGKIKTNQSFGDAFLGDIRPRISFTDNFENFSRYEQSPYRIIVDQNKLSQESIDTGNEEFEKLFLKDMSLDNISSIAIDITNPQLLDDIQSGRIEEIKKLAEQKGIKIEEFEGKILEDVGSNREVQMLTKQEYLDRNKVETQQPLEQEAMKYDSADEFVESKIEMYNVKSTIKSNAQKYKIPGQRKSFNLKDILKTDSLFDAYPQLKESKVIVKDLYSAGEATGHEGDVWRAGVTRMVDGQIFLDTDYVENSSLEEISETLAHEIEHSLGNFSKTGTTGMDRSEYDNLPSEIDARNRGSRKYYTDIYNKAHSQTKVPADTKNKYLASNEMTPGQISEKAGEVASMKYKTAEEFLSSKDKTTVFYNDKVVDMDYIDNKKEQFKFGAMRIADNINTGKTATDFGFIKTPDGKFYEVGTTDGTAKLVTEEYVNNKLGNKTQVSEKATEKAQVSSLEQEARKYKTADEFIKGLNDLLTKSAKDYNGRVVTDFFMRIAETDTGQTVIGLNDMQNKINNADYDGFKRLAENTGFQYTKEDINLVMGLQDFEYGGTPSTETLNKVMDLSKRVAAFRKQKLTDIWNKANKTQVSEKATEKGVDREVGRATVQPDTRIDTAKQQTQETQHQQLEQDKVSVETRAKIETKKESSYTDAITIKGKKQETKQRTLSRKVQEKAAQENLEGLFEEVPEYETKNVQEQLNWAGKIVDEDYEYAKDIVSGKKDAPTGLLPESVFAVLEKEARLRGDIETINMMGTNSVVTSESSVMGQRLRMLAERDPYSPSAAIQSAIKARIKAVEKVTGNSIDKTRKQIRDEIKKNRKGLTKADWIEFVNSIDVDSKIKEKLVSGEIDPEALFKMSSAKRRAFFETFMHDNEAKKINKIFERRTLQKDFWNAMIRWAEEVAGIKQPLRMDLISKIERMRDSKQGNVLDAREENEFLNELANSKLGVEVNLDESREIVRLSEEVSNAKEEAGDMTDKKKRINYGNKIIDMNEYLQSLKPGRTWLEQVANVLAVPRAVMASLDMSAPGRQGWGMVSRPQFWTNIAPMVKAFFSKKTFKDIQAEILTRPTYQAMKKSGLRITGLGDVLTEREEAFMTDLIDKVPGISGSERAYTAFLSKLRADVFDKLYRDATLLTDPKTGKPVIDMSLGSKDMKDIANVVNVFTGAGTIGRYDTKTPVLNMGMFSVRKFFSSLQILFNPGNYVNTPWKKSNVIARKAAIRNFIGMVSVSGTLLYLASLGDWEVEWNTNSSDFGKIRIGNTRIDLTGGLGNYIVMASRMITGKTKSSTTGTTTELGSGFGKTSRLDLLARFMRNKLSPVASLFADMWAGENAIGEKFTWTKALITRAMPIVMSSTIETIMEGDVNGAIIGAVFDFMGFGSNTYGASENWNEKTTKEMYTLKEEVGQERFDELNEEYNVAYTELLKNVNLDRGWQALPDSEQKDVISKHKKQIKKAILDGDEIPLYEPVDMTEEEKEAMKVLANKREFDFDGDWIDAIAVYSKALGTDPVATFKYVFNGEVLRRVDDDTIIVHRGKSTMSEKQREWSHKMRTEFGATEEQELDHIIPLQLGGLNYDKNNLRLLDIEDHDKITEIGNDIGRRLRSGEITSAEALAEFKAEDEKLFGNKKTKKKESPMNVSETTQKKIDAVKAKNDKDFKTSIKKLRETRSAAQIYQLFGEEYVKKRLTS